jgi:TfoX/Sxy family transcriptional regulator of competence genes
MASKQANVDFVVEQMAEAGDVSARKMFGEYAIYLDGKIVALFCDDQLFIKPTKAGLAKLGNVREKPPYLGAKPWFFISGDRCEDGEWLSHLARVTADELPVPKPKLRTAAKSAKSAKKPAKTKAKAAPQKPKPKTASRRKPSRN